jgi:hypothetical protein
MLPLIAISISVLSFLGAAIILIRILLKRLVGRYPHAGSPAASVWGGLFIFTIGLFEFFHTRWEALAHRPAYYKRALVTPAQGYAASIGNCILGVTFIIVALYQCRKTGDNPPHNPGI